MQRIHHLKYTQYKYFLNFNNISIDLANQTAIVFLAEGHDVVFEISEMIDKTDPIISRMRNLEHMITLKKTQDGWKIVSDNYNDYLWRFLRDTNYSTDEILIMLSNKSEEILAHAQTKNMTSSCNLPADESVHSYNRVGVVAYAHKYAENPNPDYYYFPDTDCTNFVSQALHHGSNAEEVGSNTYGWYYNYYKNYNDYDYSASWTDVQFSYDFITQYYVWDKGPEGCEINNDYAVLKGDLVQFEWNGDTTWDHAMIIVERQDDPYDPYNPTFYVSGHSTDVDNYPLNSIVYASKRFIHIERIDGYAKIYLPSVHQENNIRTLMQPTHPSPYPEPININEQSGAIEPYSAP